MDPPSAVAAPPPAPTPLAPAPAPPTASPMPSSASAGPVVAELDLSGAWGSALREADLGVADGTTDDAARVAAMKRCGMGSLDLAKLKALIARASKL